MKARRAPRFVLASVLSGVSLGGFTHHAVAGDDGSLGDSLASPFIQSRTMVQILRADDPLDRSCYERKFADAWVVPTSAKVTSRGNVSERKWQEQWTLVRCGKSIGYRVFYTEVGEGGVYFSVRTVMHMARPSSLSPSPRLADLERGSTALEE